MSTKSNNTVATSPSLPDQGQPGLASTFPSRRAARGHVGAMLKRIKASHEAGQRKLVQRLIGVYLNSLDARYVAVLEAYLSLKKHRRPKATLLPAYAQALDAWKGTQEKVLLILKQKPNGNFRDLKDFGIENRALQYLVLPLLLAQANLHPCQYGTKGVHAAVQCVADLMGQGYGWAIETDIQDCYPSFEREKVPCLLPLPKRVTQNVLFCDPLNMSLGNNSIFGPASDDEDHITFVDVFADAQRGFPQGSAASPIAVEILLAPLFDGLPDGGHSVGYADNILVMAKEEGDAVSMTLALWSALKAHPAGHLRPKEPRVFQPGKPIDFLGHRLTMQGGAVLIAPTPENLQKFKLTVDKGLARIARSSGSIRVRHSHELRRYVCSWCAAFKLWHEVIAHRAVTLERIKTMTSPD